MADVNVQSGKADVRSAAHAAGVKAIEDRLALEARHSNTVRNRDQFSKEDIAKVAREVEGVTEGKPSRKGFQSVITKEGDLVLSLTANEIGQVKNLIDGKKFEAPENLSPEAAGRSKLITQLVAYNIDAVRNSQKGVSGAEALPAGDKRARIYIDPKKFLESASKSRNASVVNKALDVAIDATRGRLVQEQINREASRSRESGQGR